VPVHRVGALPARFTRLAGLGNLAYRAWFSLSTAGARLLREQKFDLVYFSTTQFVITALGPRWFREFGVPYVIDLQDPWRTDYYERPGAPRPPGGWKYRFARWQAARLEEPAWRSAAGFIAVSEDYLVELRRRYPWFAAKPSVVIPFGAPEADFALARDRDDIAPVFTPEADTINFVSVGAVGPIMQGALERLFASVRALRASDRPTAARLRFHFIGTSYATGRRALPSVAPIAAQFGVSDLVREQTTRVGYFVAIKTMLAADAIIVPGSNDPGYNPSKIATCFLARKPTLALTPPNSAFERMVSDLSFAAIARIPATNTATADTVITDFLRRVVPHATVSPFMRNTTLFSATHSARARTRQQCELFERALPVKS
jgi:glycosyltransferase involved in cell wall biosynthesis